MHSAGDMFGEFVGQQGLDYDRLVFSLQTL